MSGYRHRQVVSYAPLTGGTRFSEDDVVLLEELGDARPEMVLRDDALAPLVLVLLDLLRRRELDGLLAVLDGALLSFLGGLGALLGGDLGEAGDEEPAMGVSASEDNERERSCVREHIAERKTGVVGIADRDVGGVHIDDIGRIEVVGEGSRVKVGLEAAYREDEVGLLDEITDARERIFADVAASVIGVVLVHSGLGHGCRRADQGMKA